MSGTTAVVIADSLSPFGDRVTSLELRFPRFILPQVLTHRSFSRSTASSRAIPTKKLLEQVRNDPAVPLEFGSNKPGMQAGAPVEDVDLARDEWRMAASAACGHAEWLLELNVHKQIANRILDPFTYTTMIVTATDWDNFFKLRLDDAAQPEMQELAKAMFDALTHSTANWINWHEWHLPYIRSEDREVLASEDLCKISAARCARVSYLNHNGERDYQKDLNLYTSLVADGHLSPLEHPCTPAKGSSEERNLKYWLQLRTQVELAKKISE